MREEEAIAPGTEFGYVLNIIVLLKASCLAVVAERTYQTYR
jgi:hypothetical protein